jgi:hypothetical protein
MTDAFELVEKSFQEAQDFGNAFTAAVVRSFVEKCPDARALLNTASGQYEHDLMMRTFGIIIKNLRTPQQLRTSLCRYIDETIGMFFADPDPVIKCGDAIIEILPIFLNEQWTPNLHAAWAMAFNGAYRALEYEKPL